MAKRITILTSLAACALLVAILGLTGLLVLAKPSQDPPPPTQATYFQPFKGKPDDLQRYLPRGPDVADHLAFEPDGLRIKLPPGYPAQRPSVGLDWNSTVHGNFDIAVRFDLLKEPSPEDAGNHATRVTLGVLLDTPERNEAAISRRMIAKGKRQFFTFLLMDQGKGKAAPKLDTVATQTKIGRLRLVRNGSTLSCFAAEGADGDFALVKEHLFSTVDVKQVFLHASTGGPRAELDVRLSDLRIVADALPDLAERAARPTGSMRWIVAAVIVNGAILVVMLTGWVLWRQHPAAPVQPELGAAGKKVSRK